MKRKSEGRLTCVFDLVISTYDSICLHIQNDFKDFFNIRLINNIKNSKYKNPSNTLFHSYSENKKYNDGLICNNGMLFNHESPGNPVLCKTENWGTIDKFTKNNFKEFKERYSRRITNFNKAIEKSLNTNQKLYFVLNTYYTPIKLSNIIKNKYPKLKFEILCNKLDNRTQITIANYENDICNYKKLNEKLYDPNYKDNNISMNSWHLINKYKTLLKLYDQADIINDIV